MAARDAGVSHGAKLFSTPQQATDSVCDLKDGEGEIGFGGSVVEPKEGSRGIDRNDNNERRIAEKRDRNLELRPRLSGHKNLGFQVSTTAG